MKLPDCQMPDGAEPCEGYKELDDKYLAMFETYNTGIAELEQQVKDLVGQVMDLEQQVKTSKAEGIRQGLERSIEIICPSGTHSRHLKDAAKLIRAELEKSNDT